MPRLEPDLPVREAKAGQARRRQRLIAHTVLGLLRGRAVITQAVGLDDEAQVRPIEVDPEATDVGLCAGFGETGTACDGQEVALELRVGESEGPAIEGLRRTATPGRNANVSRSLLRTSGSIRSSLSASLIAASSSSWHRRVAISTRVRTVLVTRIPSCSRTCSSPSQALRWTTMPSSRGRPARDSTTSMTSRRFARTPSSAAASPWLRAASIPAAQDSGHPASVPRDLRTPDGVDAPPDRVQSAARDAMLYPARREAEFEELVPCDHAVLSAGELPDPPDNLLDV